MQYRYTQEHRLSRRFQAIFASLRNSHGSFDSSLPSNQFCSYLGEHQPGTEGHRPEVPVVVDAGAEQEVEGVVARQSDQREREEERQQRRPRVEEGQQEVVLEHERVFKRGCWNGCAKLAPKSRNLQTICCSQKWQMFAFATF